MATYYVYLFFQRDQYTPGYADGDAGYGGFMLHRCFILVNTAHFCGMKI